MPPGNWIGRRGQLAPSAITGNMFYNNNFRNKFNLMGKLAGIFRVDFRFAQQIYGTMGNGFKGQICGIQIGDNQDGDRLRGHDTRCGFQTTHHGQYSHPS